MKYICEVERSHRTVKLAPDGEIEGSTVAAYANIKTVAASWSARSEAVELRRLDNCIRGEAVFHVVHHEHRAAVGLPSVHKKSVAFRISGMQNLTKLP